MRDRDTAPAEGLPPCVKRVAIFEGRQATLHAGESCPDPEIAAGMNGYRVCAGHRGTVRNPYHDIDITTLRDPMFMDVLTGDPDEAQAAFDKGAEWVRTGEGP